MSGQGPGVEDLYQIAKHQVGSQRTKFKECRSAGRSDDPTIIPDLSRLCRREGGEARFIGHDIGECPISYCRVDPDRGVHSAI